MIDKDKIRNIIELFIAWNGETEVIDIANIDSAVEFISSSLQEEPVSEELEEAAKNHAVERYRATRDMVLAEKCKWSFKAGAKWQKQQDQSTIELAEDHAYFAGRTKTIEEIEEKLLSEVLPCFMHGGEADEVVAKLDEVLNQKK